MSESRKDGSDVLALALEKIDDLIAGQNSDEIEVASSNRSQVIYNESNQDYTLAEHDSVKLIRSKSRVNSWLGKSSFEKFKNNGNRNDLEFGEMQFDDTVRLLQLEKENLLLQISVMNDQIDAQNDKIKDLEDKLITISRKVDTKGEECSKSLLDEAKRELLLEISQLRNNKSNMSEGFSENISKLEQEVDELRTTLLKKETEASLLRLSLARMAKNTGYTLSESEMKLLRGKSSSLELLAKRHQQDKMPDKPPVAPRLKLGSPPISHHFGTETGFNVDLRSKSGVNSSLFQVPLSPESKRRSASTLIRTNSSENMNKSKAKLALVPYQGFSTIPRIQGTQVLQKIQEELKPHELVPYTPPLYNSTSLKFDNPQLKETQPNHEPTHSAHQSTSGSKKSSVISFAQEDLIISNPSQHSTPNISSAVSLRPAINVNSFIQKEAKPKGLKKFLRKIKRSDTYVSNIRGNQFARGGLRSSLGPRCDDFAKQKIEINLPFSKWDVSLVAHWFTIIGLGMYSANCKRVIKNGDHLINSTESEIEKELGIKNRLHRKKLRLALSCVNNDCDQMTKSANKLDYLWIAKWLDDIGLPQYKEAFVEARIDGSVLHHLTIEDLTDLNLTTRLHYASIKRGIQVLRSQNFNPNCLKRRASPEEANKEDWSPELISLWTSHRTMEWLRSIDLSEYTPNLRGSGVHGAMIIHEPLFDSDLLATLLSIPSTKTLLRRHLTTYFNKLIGPKLVQVKRDCQAKSTPLLPSTKLSINTGKFSLIRRRGKSQLHVQDYVCPLSDKIETECLDENEKMPSDDSFANDSITESYI